MVILGNGDLNISDSVITGDVTNISQNNRVTCEFCKATGNLTIFTCIEVNCENTFCEHCRSSYMPNSCNQCNKDKIDQIKQKQNDSLKSGMRNLEQYFADKANNDSNNSLNRSGPGLSNWIILLIIVSLGISSLVYLWNYFN